MTCRRWPWLMVAALLLAGCGDDEEKKKEVEAGLPGNWQVTSCIYASKEDLGTVDLIAQGCTAGLVMGEAGSWVYTCTPPGGPPTVIEATWELAGDYGDIMEVTRLGVGWSWSFDVDLDGNDLGLANASAVYDFNDDGMPDESRWSLVLVRVTGE